MKNSSHCLVFCLIILVISPQATAAITVFEYDNQDRLIHVAYDSAANIHYTFDDVGNRLSMNSVGNELDSPEVLDSGVYSLNNTLLDLVVSQYGDGVGDLTYEYAIGTSPCANDVLDWTSFTIQGDGSVQVNDLSLPYGQQYFVCVRAKNFAGEIVSGNGVSDGITILENHPPFEVFHIFRHEDANQSISILWDTIDKESYDIFYKDTFEGSFQYATTVSASGMNGTWTDNGASTGTPPADTDQRYYLVHHADTDASNTVGTYKLNLNEGMNLISLPLIPFSNALEDVIGSQLEGADNEAASDRVWVWNGSNYEFAWLVDGVGEPYDGSWYSGNQPANITLDADQGAWVQIREGHGPQQLSIVGEVAADNRQIPIAEGMNLVGTSYPVPVDVANSNIWESGLSGADNESQADRIWRWAGNHYDFFWLVDGVGAPYDGQWFTGNQPGELTLEPGKGYWIQRRDGNNDIVWEYTKPY